MLLGQNSCRGQKRRLPAAHDCLEAGPHRHFGFTVANVAADEPVHGVRAFHILFNFLHTAELVFGFLEGKSRLEHGLPFGVFGKGKTLGLFAPGIQGDQFFGNIFNGFFYPALAVFPAF